MTHIVEVVVVYYQGDELREMGTYSTKVMKLDTADCPSSGKVPPAGWTLSLVTKAIISQIFFFQQIVFT